MSVMLSSDNGKPVEIEVVDCQVHANQLGPNWRTEDPSNTLLATLTSMKALGISRMVVDEFTDLDPEGRMLPGEIEADGFWRPRRPFSRLAMQAHPDKFRYLGRVDRLDPRLEDVMKQIRDDEFGPCALRVQAGPKRVVWSDPDFVEGRYTDYFELAQRYSIPLFLVIAPRADMLATYAKQFPECQFILDHMGVVSGVGRPAADESAEDRMRRFDNVVALAEYPNVSVKWSHVERFAATPYPFNDVTPALRRVVDAFGADRVMWAGDPTELANPTKTDFPITWGQALHHIVDASALTVEEKAWILGGTAKKILGWN